MLAEGEQGNLVCLYGAGWSLHQALEHFICSVNTRIQVSPNPTHKHLSSQLHSTPLVKPDGSKSLTKDRLSYQADNYLKKSICIWTLQTPSLGWRLLFYILPKRNLKLH